MEKAFSASRVDSYADRQFSLDREVLLERHLDRGDKLLMASAVAPFPDLFMAQTYADHLLFDVGEREERAGRNKEALAAYQTVAAFATQQGDLRAKPNISSSMNWIASHLGWASVALPIACLGIFLSFFPHSRSIAEYATGEELVLTYASLLDGLGSLQISLTPIIDFWTQHMFWPLIWCAVIALLGAVYLRWQAWRRETNRSGLD